MQMRTLMIKMYLSIVSCLLILCTCVTTTYAWFGLQEYSNAGSFNLKVTQTSGDGLEISTDGVNFKSYLSASDMSAIVPTNGRSANACTSYYNAAGTELSGFYDMEGEACEDYIYFEIYLTATYDINVADHDVEVYFSSDILGGSVKQTPLVNGLNHPEFGYMAFPTMNTKNTSRVAIVKHDVTPVGKRFASDGSIDTRDYAYDTYGNIIYDANGYPTYDDSSTTNIFVTSSESSANPSTDIYYSGYVPTDTDIAALKISEDDPNFDYDDAVEYYRKKGKQLAEYTDFGGIDADFNMTTEEWNTIRTVPNLLSVPTSVYNREEKLLNHNLVLSTSDGLRPTTMMKLGVYFWIEGWDSDCFGSSGQNVSLRLSFTTIDPNLE